MEKKKSVRWYVKFPLDAYALGPVGPFRSESEVKEWARQWLGCVRLPRGFQCWKEE